MKLVIFLLPFVVLAGKVERTKLVTQKKLFNDGALKRFDVSTYNYKVVFSDGERAYGSTAYGDYHTQSIDDLRDFIMVQYIRGCQFSSRLRADGQVERYISRSREFFGDVVPFIHKNWVIDSVDVDPAYNSDERLPRHALYRWNERDGYNSDFEHYAYERKPERARLYVRDMPGTAFYTEAFKEAQNISLEFEMCLFKNSDVPLVSAPDTDFKSKAIKCFSWNSSFIYNFKSNKFDSPKKIDTFCLK